MFDDLLDANRRYRAEFHDSGVAGKAAKGLAVLTCIDSRIDPLALLGLRPGDAKIIRNAGARVTDDALRSLDPRREPARSERASASCNTPTARWSDRPTTRCGRAISAARGVDASGWDFLATRDQLATLRADIERIRACPLLPPDLDVGGFIFDVHSGELVSTPSD